MDLITQTSLEALLLKATNPQNQNIDTAAVEAFCTLIGKEKDGVHIGVKVIASRLPSGNDKEMLQTLNILDNCMSRCGSGFQSEVGKFRFLNEMIKLVSPKYLGSQTPLIVKQKVLQLLYVWTLDYPKETKIKEAYDMLRKQGVIREIPNPNVTVQSNATSMQRKPTSSVFQDEEKSKILQKLLQSKDSEDIQAANWLIKSMVKEDDKRAELKSRHITELESVQNNTRLLNEMLDSYKPGLSSSDELDLIKELHTSCERLRPNLMKLAAETQHNEEILGDVLQASDELTQVFTKFNTIIVQGKCQRQPEQVPKNSLLDFELLGDGAKCAQPSSSSSDNASRRKSEIDVLCDVFNASPHIPESDILQPISLLPDKPPDAKDKDKYKGLEELDVLSAHLLRENLNQSSGQQFFKGRKTPLNLLPKDTKTNQKTVAISTTTTQESLNFDYLLVNKSKEQPQAPPLVLTPKNKSPLESGDDFLVDFSGDEKLLEDHNHPEEQKDDQNNKKELIKLSDISIRVEDIKPNPRPPVTLMDEADGLKITLHFARDKPREDISVFVLTTLSKNPLPLTDYLFRAVVPKGFKIRLQEPSATTLPSYNQFVPPAFITQVMLISSPEGVPLFLKYIVSYVVDDETFTEMGESENLNV